MKPIQDPGAAIALAASLGLKGRVRLDIDEVMLATVLTQDLVDSPYGPVIPISGARRSGAGGAGVESGVSIEPGENTVLVVDEVQIEEESSAVLAIEVRWLLPADIAAVTTGSSGLSVNQNGILRGGVVPRTAALVRSITHTAPLGTVIARGSTPNDTQLVISLGKRGLALYGNDPAGVSALCAWNLTDNLPMAVNFQGREFRIPG